MALSIKTDEADRLARELSRLTGETMTEAEKKPDAARAYDASSIQVLEGLEAVRKRPGMYIWNTSFEGLHHLIWEVLDNSIDECMAGEAREIEVILHEDAARLQVKVGQYFSGTGEKQHEHLFLADSGAVE